MPSDTNPILEILQKKLIPWVRESGMERVIVAQPTLERMGALPAGQVSPKKRCGKRRATRGKNHHEILATWPEDRQVEVSAPQLVFVISGKADLHFGDYLLHCQQGTGVFIPPGVPKPSGPYPHLAGEKGSCELLWLRPLGRRIQAWICRSRDVQHFSPQEKEVVFILDGSAVRRLEDLRRELEAQRSSYREISDHLLRAFLLAVWRDLQEDRYFHPSSTPENEMEGAALNDPIARAQQYMREHLHLKLTLENVAREVHLSRAQFARRFHQQSGQTFTAFLTQCRLEQAAVILRETDFTLVYICRVLGYRSPTYFHNLFQRHTKMAPLEFRRQSRKQNALQKKRR
jgi:AraC-like DNA-binding protein